MAGVLVYMACSTVVKEGLTAVLAELSIHAYLHHDNDLKLEGWMELYTHTIMRTCPGINAMHASN